MGTAAETETKLCNPILHFASWKSMDHTLLMLCYSVNYIMYQGRNMVMGKIFGDGKISDIFK